MADHDVVPGGEGVAEPCLTDEAPGQCYPPGSALLGCCRTQSLCVRVLYKFSWQAGITRDLSIAERRNSVATSRTVRLFHR